MIEKVIRFVQLRSLIIEVIYMQMNELESFLFLTPSLSYLKLIGKYSKFHGKRWEQFIQVNLPHLEQFQFDIRSSQWIQQTPDDCKTMIESFRSPFWVEDKKWFVQCQWDPICSYEYELCSIPTV